MLHEILFSLWGCTTGMMKVLEADTIELDKYLHPGERALLQRILCIVQECNKIRKFVSYHMPANSVAETMDETENLQQGLYLAALCDGIDQALRPFRTDIVRLENIVLNDSHTPLSFVLCQLEQHVCLFSILNSIIREIGTQKLHGCKLLQCLHGHMHTGIPDVRQALEKIIRCVHVVFYKHLTSWLLYGYLEDPYQEFFIRNVSSGEKTAVSAVKNGLEASEEKLMKKQAGDMWDYTVQVEMLPSYIRPSLATKILTVGQTIIMFGNDPRQKKDFSVITKDEHSIWGEKEYEYFQKLQNLQRRPLFDIIEFERTIDELKECVTELLWRVAVEEAQLMQQLRLIKEFFLMGRGDLFVEFIRLTAHILDKPPTGHTSRDVNLAFQMALRKTQLNDEIAMESFNFIIPLPTSCENDDENIEDTVDFTEKEREDPIEKRGWGLVILKYKVVWPLHLLFSPAALHDYNTLFRFLLRVKKTQINLWQLWSKHKHLKNIDNAIIQLRNKLIFIVDNLQYYLQVDVLEGQYTTLEMSMKNTRNFEDVQRSHSVFLANVMSQTFLLGSAAERKNPVNKLINIFLRLCDDFILQASVWEVSNLLLTEKEELEGLSEMLDSVMDWLTKTLNRVRAQPSGEHLAQLLLRLNFNRWFSRNVQ